MNCEEEVSGLRKLRNLTAHGDTLETLDQLLQGAWRDLRAWNHNHLTGMWFSIPGAAPVALRSGRGVTSWSWPVVSTSLRTVFQQAGVGLRTGMWWWTTPSPAMFFLTSFSFIIALLLRREKETHLTLLFYCHLSVFRAALMSRPCCCVIYSSLT